MNDQNACWPGGKRIAVLVSILFETWTDGKGPSYFPRTTPLKPGTVDRGAIQWAQYGGNEGLWRILRTLDRHGVPATIFCSGRAGELYPDVIKQAAKAALASEASGQRGDSMVCARRTLALNRARRRAPATTSPATATPRTACSAT